MKTVKTITIFREHSIMYKNTGEGVGGLIGLYGAMDGLENCIIINHITNQLPNSVGRKPK